MLAPMKALALVAALALAAGGGKAGLKLTIKSESKDKIEVFIDGKKHLDAAGTVELKLSAGKHLLRIVKGGDATEEEFALKAGETLNKELEFN